MSSHISIADHQSLPTTLRCCDEIAKLQMTHRLPHERDHPKMVSVYLRELIVHLAAADRARAGSRPVGTPGDRVR